MKETFPAVEARDLIARAAAWRLAALLLERPRAQWKDEIGKLRSEVTNEDLLSSAEKAKQGTEEDYHRLFGPGGAVSPREVSYCGFEDPGRLMAELQSYYQAFSYLPRREEPVDHVSVEAGFVSYLLLKEAYARTRNDFESVRITKDARKRFVAEHLARCAGGIIERSSPMPPYLLSVLSWMGHRARV
jgi:TorA maturation chaperone TorD